MNDSKKQSIFQLEMEKPEDILTLENKIRQLLQCESVGGCNILQSAPYKRLINAVLLRMNNIISFEEQITIHLGFSGMSLVMLNDAKTVEIRNRLDTNEMEACIKRPKRDDDSVKQQQHPQQTDNADGKRKRKYSRQKQEDVFVSKYLCSKNSAIPI